MQKTCSLGYLPAYMNENLKNMFLSLASFSEKELEEAGHFFKNEHIRKNEYFSKQGGFSDRIGFVESGLLRSFYIIKGKETTTFFLLPGSVAAALRSFLHMKPAIENIQAIVDSELIVINRKDLFRLYEGNWKWQQVGRVIIENSYIEMEQRSISLQSMSAQERYAQLLQQSPEIVKHVPLHHIASFLGITPETLSRIRSQK